MIYTIEKLNFRYPGAQQLVLDQIDLNVQEGEVLTLLGRNGAGKSTLLDCMLGLLKPQSGSLHLDGKPLAELSERQIATLVGYVPQNHIPSFSYSVLDFVVMGGASAVGLFSRPGQTERQQALAALKELGIAHLAQRPYTEISGGERQQATVARAIMSKPRVVLFDEPTAHLDYCNQLRVLRIIKQLSQTGYAVVFTTHNPDHALLLGGRAALFDGAGHLECGMVEEIIHQDKLRQVYGTDVLLVYVESLGRQVCVYPNL